MTNQRKIEHLAKRIIKSFHENNMTTADIPDIAYILDDKEQTKMLYTYMTSNLHSLINTENSDDTECLEINIMDTDLPSSLKHTLICAGKKTMGEVLNMPKEIVVKFRNVGKKKITQLDDWFKQHNLWWK